MLDVERIRRDVPILQRMVHNKPLIYLDNAATSQKPVAVTDAIVETTRGTTPTSIAASIPSVTRRRRVTRQRGRRRSDTSTRRRRRASSSRAMRRRRSTSWRMPGVRIT